MQQNGRGTKRNHAWIDVSEDEEKNLSPKVNGISQNSRITPGANGRSKKMRHGLGSSADGSGMITPKFAALQEQRKQLPIAKGMQSSHQMHGRDTQIFSIQGERRSSRRFVKTM